MLCAGPAASRRLLLEQSLRGLPCSMLALSMRMTVADASLAPRGSQSVNEVLHVSMTQCS